MIVTVLLAPGSGVGEIYLPVGLSSIMSEKRTYEWGRRAQIERDGEDVLRFALPVAETDAELLKHLVDLQAGLLMVALSGMRIQDHPQRAPLLELDLAATRVDLQLEDGDTGFLAFWNADIGLKTAARIMSQEGYIHFVLIRGIQNGGPRLSVVLRPNRADWGLERVVELQTQRAQPVMIPADEKTIPDGADFRESHPFIHKKIFGEKRAQASSLTEWEDPFWDILIRGASPPPPIGELDRISEVSSTRLSRQSPSDRVRSPTLRTLSQAWRLGATDPDAAPDKPFRVPAWIHEILEERARVIDEIDARGEPNLLRTLTRVSALQAWRIGLEGRGGERRIPKGVFREERPPETRMIPIPEQETLMVISQGRRLSPSDRNRLPALLSEGLIRDVNTYRLTRLGVWVARRVMAELRESPSILEICRPNADVLRVLALGPEKKAAKKPHVSKPSKTPPRRKPVYRAETDWADPFLAKLASDAGAPCPIAELDLVAHEVHTPIRDRATTGPFQKRILGGLKRAFHLGRAAGEGERGPLGAPPALVVGFLRERSRVIETLTRADPDPGRLHALLRICCLQAWRIGLESCQARLKVLEPGFLEECAAEMRGLSMPARALLLGISEPPQIAPPASDERDELSQRKLISLTGNRVLTRKGLYAIRRASMLAQNAPSLMDLLIPTLDAISGLSPLRAPDAPEQLKTVTASKPAPPPFMPEPPSPEEISAIVTDPNGERALLDLLTRYWRGGHHGDLGAESRGSIPTLIGPFLRERSRAIWGATHMDRLEGATLVSGIIRDQAMAMLELGAGAPKRRAPVPAFRDECSAPMRAVPPHLRALLIAAHQGEIASPFPKGSATALRKRGLLIGAGSGLLTDKGRDLVFAELNHRKADLPWVRPDGPRPIPEPIGEEPESADVLQAAAPKMKSRRGSAPTPPYITDIPLSDADKDLIGRMSQGALRSPASPRMKGATRREAQIRMALIDCWRAGVNGAESRYTRLGRRQVALYLQERTRVLAEAISPDREGDALQLIMESATEAFRLGALSATAKTPPLPPRFSEECSIPMRMVPHAARAALIRAYEKGLSNISIKHLATLELAEMIDQGVPVKLTRAGRDTVIGEYAAQETPRPSILSLLGPDRIS